jgi:hypothetical protein
MPLFNLSEQISIKEPWMSVDECIFRNNVIGDSARNFQDIVPRELKPLDFVEELFEWLFGEETKRNYPQSWRNLINMISYELQKSKKDDDFNVVNSMMRHRNEDNTIIWASKLMEVLAGRILERRDTSVYDALKSMLGASAVGLMFESLGHRKLSTSKSNYLLKPLLPATNTSHVQSGNVSMNFNRPRELLRSIEDISRLSNDSYGLPLFGNYPVVDAIIQPDTVLQYATSPNEHEGNLSQLRLIRSQLKEKDPTKHKFVFVIPSKNGQTFQFQSDLGDIRQYITYDDAIVSYEMLYTTAEIVAVKRKAKKSDEVVAVKKQAKNKSRK